MKKTFLVYLAWLVLSGTAVFLVVRTAGKVQTTVADRNWETPANGIYRIWFNASAGFVAGQVDGLHVRALRIRPVVPSGQSGVEQIAAWMRSSDRTLISIAPDGNFVVTVDGHDLAVLARDGRIQSRLSLPEGAHPVLVRWSSAGVISVLRDDGSALFYAAKDLSSLGGAQTTLEAADDLVVNGVYTALGNRTTGEVHVLDTRTLPKVRVVDIRKVGRRFLALGLSSEGKLAIATQEGPILGETALPAQVVARALSFDSQGRLLAGGDFRGILLADGSSEPLTLKGPKGATAIAGNATHLVYATQDRLGALSVRKVPALSRDAAAVLKSWMILSSGMLVAMAVVVTARWGSASKAKAPFDRANSASAGS